MASFAASRIDWGAATAAVGVLGFGALAWYWSAREASLMAAMGEMQMPPTDWLSPQGLFVLGMWLTMMQAMMLPAALPMILVYRRCLLRDPQRTVRLWLFCAQPMFSYGPVLRCCSPARRCLVNMPECSTLCACSFHRRWAVWFC